MQFNDFISDQKNQDLTKTHEYQMQNLPTLWLLGKTGAGKSSIIQSITQQSSIEIGNGFKPCTLFSSLYSFPEDKPLMRFLDTRGLSEAAYDPKEDIETAIQSGHALLVVMKIDEPEQSAVLNALKKIKKTKIKYLLLIHTNALSQTENERNRLIQYQYQQVKQIWGKDFSSIAIDINKEEQTYYHQDELIDALTAFLPVIGLMNNKKEQASLESQQFNQYEKEILWYAGSAAASDLFPLVGLVSVPAVQAKMLHELATLYAITWNKRILSEFIGAMGSSFMVQYSIRLGTRQLAKMLPFYGQTLGAAAAAAMSFGSTYALGRAACYYFYHKNNGVIISEKALQQIYKTALLKGKKASGYEDK